MNKINRIKLNGCRVICLDYITTLYTCAVKQKLPSSKVCDPECIDGGIYSQVKFHQFGQLYNSSYHTDIIIMSKIMWITILKEIKINLIQHNKAEIF